MIFIQPPNILNISIMNVEEFITVFCAVNLFLYIGLLIHDYFRILIVLNEIDKKVLILDYSEGHESLKIAKKLKSFYSWYNYRLISIDSYKYLFNWERVSDDIYNENLCKSIAAHEHCIVYGTLGDILTEVKTPHYFLEAFDKIIYLDTPKYTVLWYNIKNAFDRLYASDSTIKLSEMIAKIETSWATHDYNVLYTQDICKSRKDIIKIRTPFKIYIGYT